MQKRHESNPQDTPSTAVGALEERLEALERQIAERPAGAESEHHTHASHPLQDELSAQLERHRDELRDYEKALVERIADVDDDRRATASRMQRAWQAQREEIDNRLRRNAVVVAGLLVLFAVLVAGALFLIYHQATIGQPQLAAEVAELRQRLTAISSADTGGDRAREELERLNEEIRQIASSLGQLKRDGDPDARSAVADERAAREENEARAADQIRGIAATQNRLIEQLESLQAAQDAIGTERADGQVVAGAAPPGQRGAPRLSSRDVDPEQQETGPVADEGGVEIHADSRGGEDTKPAVAESELMSAPRVPESRSPADGGALISTETFVVGEGTYALQLIGFFESDSLNHFVAREALPEQVYFLRETYKDRPWYALIHSLHQGYTAAAKEFSSLPTELASLNPWIRLVPAGTRLRVLDTGPETEDTTN